jgi:nucleoside-diphosphate-sugar epimerase
VIEGDARDEDKLKSLLKGIDYIIPLAALVGAPLQQGHIGL